MNNSHGRLVKNGSSCTNLYLALTPLILILAHQQQTAFQKKKKKQKKLLVKSKFFFCLQCFLLNQMIVSHLSIFLNKILICCRIGRAQNWHVWGTGPDRKAGTILEIHVGYLFLILTSYSLNIMTSTLLDRGPKFCDMYMYCRQCLWTVSARKSRPYTTSIDFLTLKWRKERFSGLLKF